MKALLQRVSAASVEVDTKKVSSIGRGLLVFLGVARSDTEQEAERLARKIVSLRIFPHEGKAFDRSLLDTGYEILLVSQFTLYANTVKGRRPDFFEAADPTQASSLYEHLGEELAQQCHLAKGIFGASMRVSLVNEGPATILLEV